MLSERDQFLQIHSISDAEVARLAEDFFGVKLTPRPLVEKSSQSAKLKISAGEAALGNTSNGTGNKVHRGRIDLGSKDVVLGNNRF